MGHHGKKPATSEPSETLGTMEILIFMVPLVVLLCEAVPDMITALRPAASRLFTLLTVLLFVSLLPVGVALVWLAYLLLININKIDSTIEALTQMSVGAYLLLPLLALMLGLGVFCIITSCIFIHKLVRDGMDVVQTWGSDDPRPGTSTSNTQAGPSRSATR